jgi:hypothetical protein
MASRKRTYNKRLFAQAPKLIGLDLGCGKFKQEPIYGMPFLGLDMVKREGVDIVHDLQKFPWPVPSGGVQIIKASHVWEHIEPKYRMEFMDECWRICRAGGQLWLSAPHAGSVLEAGHPCHYPCPNELTFQFFDPDYQLYHSCSYKQPRPWRIMRNDPNLGGCIELVMEPRKKPNGRPEIFKQPKKKDYARIEGI